MEKRPKGGGVQGCDSVQTAESSQPPLQTCPPRWRSPGEVVQSAAQQSKGSCSRPSRDRTSAAELPRESSAEVHFPGYVLLQVLVICHNVHLSQHVLDWVWREGLQKSTRISFHIFSWLLEQTCSSLTASSIQS